MVLSGFDRDVHAIADVEMFGIVTAAPQERAKMITRLRTGASSHLLPVGRLWSVLTPHVAATTMVTPLASRADASHPIVHRLLKYGVDCVLTIPFPDDRGVFWTGKRGAEPFGGPQVSGTAERGVSQ